MKRKEKKNSAKKAAWKATRKIIRKNTPILLLFVMIHSLLFSLVLEPAGRLLWMIALRFSPVEYLTLNNLHQLLFSPLVILAILIIGAGLACWTYFNIAAIVICIHNSMEGRPITLRILLRESADSMFRALKPQNLPVLLFAVIIIPATHTFMTTTFISELAIPEYIAEVIRANTLYLILLDAITVFTIFLTIQYMFLFQYFILENSSFREAAAKSRKLMKGHKLKDALLLIWWNIRLHFVYIVYMFLLVLLLIIIMAVGSKGRDSMLISTSLVAENVLGPLLQFFIQAIETFSQYTFIAILFYRHLAEREASSEAEAATAENSVQAVSEPKQPGAVSRDLLAFPGVDEKPGWRVRLFFPIVFLAALLFCCGLSWLTGVMIENTTILDAIMDQGPEVTSHRGYSAVAPENTLPSIQAAIDSHVAYAEIDVQLTSDGVAVLTHDTNLKRCTGADVNIYDISWDELQKLDAGSWFGEEFTGTRIPSLEQVIELSKGKIKLNIEIKNSGHSPELEAETVRVIRDMGFENDCVVTSISYDTLVKVKEVDPGIRTGYILAMGVGNYYDLPAADFFSVETTFINRKMVEAIHRRGKEVHAWTVDVESDADRMISLEVDNIITGNPPMVEEKINADRDLVVGLLQSLGDWDNVNSYFSEDVYSRLTEIYQTPETDDEDRDEQDLEDLLNEA